jgi:hypothetical protein
MQITAPTPQMIPNVVSSDRSLCNLMFLAASRIVSSICPLNMACSL